MKWKYEINLAVLLIKEEGLTELLFRPLNVYLHVLRHYHMLSVT